MKGGDSFAYVMPDRASRMASSATKRVKVKRYRALDIARLERHSRHRSAQVWLALSRDKMGLFATHTSICEWKLKMSYQLLFITTFLSACEQSLG